jgi:hypothetical protein
VFTISEKQGNTTSRLEFYDIQTGKVKQYFDFPIYNTKHESEAVINIDDNNYLLGYDGKTIWIQKIAYGGYNYSIGEYLVQSMYTEKEIKQNDTNLLDFALSLEQGVHAVQNITGATPARFQWSISLVVKNARDRCTVYAYAYDGLYMNNNTTGDKDGWGGWVFCAAQHVSLD